MVSKEEVQEIEAEMLGTRFGLRWIILALIFFHVAALVVYIILLLRGSRPVKKMASKQH
jgi:thiosulfate reductase cytochrome b subunit